MTRVKKGELTLSRILELLAKNPAKIFGLDGKGELKEGMDADITLVDMRQEHMIDPEKFHNKRRYSPFKGQKVWGEVVKTFVDGRLVYDDGEVIAKRGTGKIIKPIIKGKDMTHS